MMSYTYGNSIDSYIFIAVDQIFGPPPPYNDIQIKTPTEIGGNLIKNYFTEVTLTTNFLFQHLRRFGMWLRSPYFSVFKIGIEIDET